MPPSPAKPLAEIRSTPEEAAASSSSRPAETAAEARSLRRGLALAAAVALVWTLLLAAHFMRGPLFLVDPPITRRTSGFFELHGDSCSYKLGQGNWTDTFRAVKCTNETAAEWATCADTPRRHWHFGAAAAACGARRYSAADARALLAGRRLVFAGDSISRHLYGATLRLLGEPGQEVVVGHADFTHALPGGISLQFFWAPYPQNLTGVLQRLQSEGGAVAADAEAGSTRRLAQQQQQRGVRQRELQQQQQQQQQQPGQQRAPAMVMLSTMLWHLLHVTTAEDFGQQLAALKASAAAYARSAARGSAGVGPRLVLASGTETFPNRMKTAEKRAHMTPANLDSYNAALQQVGLLEPAGPLSLLDLFPLTQRCGEECSTDGVHSTPEVYDAALQVLINVYAAGPQRSAEAAGQAAEEELHGRRPRRRRRTLHG